MKRQAPVVTDHALVRWLERVKGIDLSVMRAEIAAVVEPAVAAGSTGLVKDGVTYVLCGATVVTVVEGVARRGRPVWSGGKKERA